MKVRVALFGHREWAHRIFSAITADREMQTIVDFVSITTISADSRYAELGISDFSNLGMPITVIDPGVKGALKANLDATKADLNLFYGWSWILPPDVTDNHMCVCLHPSYLPYYRGGSPIQNQIINGEKEGGVTLFVMAKGIDDGPIIAQQKISLAGNLSNVFDNMVEAGIALSKKMLREAADGTLKPVEQDHTKATTFKRRAREESEITAEELRVKTPEYLYNKIRALQDPYPNAYLSLGGVKILLKEAFLVEKTSGEPVIDATSLTGQGVLPFLQSKKPFVLLTPHHKNVLVTTYELSQ